VNETSLCNDIAIAMQPLDHFLGEASALEQLGKSRNIRVLLGLHVYLMLQFIDENSKVLCNNGQDALNILFGENAGSRLLHTAPIHLNESADKELAAVRVCVRLTSSQQQNDL
jgi:hypothetical protein